jgi:hypothetical protein
MTAAARRARTQTPARMGLTGVPREHCDGENRAVPAPDSRAGQPENQADPNPAVGVGPVGEPSGWPSPAEFWP